MSSQPAALPSEPNNTLSKNHEHIEFVETLISNASEDEKINLGTYLKALKDGIPGKPDASSLQNGKNAIATPLQKYHFQPSTKLISNTLPPPSNTQPKAQKDIILFIILFNY
jgi:hypothetical protein